MTDSCTAERSHPVVNSNVKRARSAVTKPSASSMRNGRHAMVPPGVQGLQSRSARRRSTGRTRGRDRTRATLAAREPGTVRATMERVRRVRQEEGLRPQEPPEAEVRAHARGLRRDARLAGRRLRHLRPRPTSTTSTTTTTPVRSAACSASRATSRIGHSTMSTSACRRPPTISTGRRARRRLYGCGRSR